MTPSGSCGVFLCVLFVFVLLFGWFFSLEASRKNTRKAVQISAILKDFKCESMLEYAFYTYLCMYTH